MYIYYQIHQTVISYNIFNSFVHETNFRRVEFPTYGGLLVFKVLVPGALWILG